MADQPILPATFPADIAIRYADANEVVTKQYKGKKYKQGSKKTNKVVIKQKKYN